MKAFFPIQGKSWSDYSGSPWVRGADEGTAGVGGWHYARSVSHLHRGIDLAAVCGTAVLAVRDGLAKFKNALEDASTIGFHFGGHRLELVAKDGQGFKYFHLGHSLEDYSSAVASSFLKHSVRNVVAGEVIGYVGCTGGNVANKTVIPLRSSHLHFEYYPFGFTGEDANPVHFFEFLSIAAR